MAAEFELGGLHYVGCGLPMDRAKALEWFRRVAEKGEAQAQFKRRADARQWRWGDEGSRAGRCLVHAGSWGKATAVRDTGWA